MPKCQQTTVKTRTIDGVTKTIVYRGGRMSAVKGPKGLATQHRRRLLLNQEERELAMWPILPTFHSTACCAQTHTISHFRGSLRRPKEIASSTRFSGQQTLQHEFSTHFNALSSATIGSLRCSSHSSNRVLFLPRMLSLRCGSQKSTPLSWAVFIFRTAFALEFSFGLLTLAASLLSLWCSYISSQSSPSVAFVDRLAKGMPISVYQWRSPSVLFNDARFLGVHFLSSERQFLGTFPG